MRFRFVSNPFDSLQDGEEYLIETKAPCYVKIRLVGFILLIPLSPVILYIINPDTVIDPIITGIVLGILIIPLAWKLYYPFTEISMTAIAIQSVRFNEIISIKVIEHQYNKNEFGLLITENHRHQDGKIESVESHLPTGYLPKELSDELFNHIKQRTLDHDLNTNQS